MNFKQVKYKSLIVPSVLIVGALFAAILPEGVEANLIYDRDMLTQGEVWRAFTGHFFHTNTNHLLLNLAAVILLWFLHHSYYSLSDSVQLLLLTFVLTSMGLYVFAPQLIWYVGLSGVLHGIFIWGALKDITQQEKTGYLLLFGAVLKIVYEQVYGADQQIIELIEANVAVDAHLWGAASGVCVFLVGLFQDKKKPT